MYNLHNRQIIQDKVEHLSCLHEEMLWLDLMSATERKCVAFKLLICLAKFA